MGGTSLTTRWPTDPDHREAIDAVLEMAAAEDRWGESARAAALLDSVERIIGALPHPYEHIRRRCRERAGRP